MGKYDRDCADYMRQSHACQEMMLPYLVGLCLMMLYGLDQRNKLGVSRCLGLFQAIDLGLQTCRQCGQCRNCPTQG